MQEEFQLGLLVMLLSHISSRRILRIHFPEYKLSVFRQLEAAAESYCSSGGSG